MYGMKYNYKYVDYYKRRLSTTNIDESLRTIMEVTFKAPIYFFRQVFQRCVYFQDQIKFIIPRLKSSSSLAVDVGCYVLLEQLRTIERKDKTITLEYSQSFKNFTLMAATFVGLVYERVDLTMILKYMRTEVVKDDTMMLLLSQLLTMVGNVGLIDIIIIILKRILYRIVWFGSRSKLVIHSLSLTMTQPFTH